MIKDPKFDRIFEDMFEYTLDWDYVFKRIKRYLKFKKRKGLKFRTYRKLSTEYSLDAFIKQRQELYPEFSITFFDGRRSRSNKYSFGQNPQGRMFAKPQNPENPNFEYDLPLVIHSKYSSLESFKPFLLLLELKLGLWRGRKKNKNEWCFEKQKFVKKYRNGIRSDMDLDLCKERISPFKEDFEERIGYGLIIPKDVYDRRQDDSSLSKESIFNSFSERAYVCPFYTSTKGFEGDLENELISRKLRVTNRT